MVQFTTWLMLSADILNKFKENEINKYFKRDY